MGQLLLVESVLESIDAIYQFLSRYICLQQTLHFLIDLIHLWMFGNLCQFFVVRFYLLLIVQIIIKKMLGKCPRVGGSRSQSSIRHEVRKLRAKVKSLLPQHNCHHYEKRNQRVTEIQGKKKLWSSTHDSHRWSSSKAENTQWFNEARSKPKKKSGHFFEELTPNQIETINQDKIYFLGEQNVKVYENFLESKHSNIIQKQKSMFDAFQTRKNVDLSQVMARAPSCLRKSFRELSSQNIDEEKKFKFLRNSPNSLQSSLKYDINKISARTLPFPIQEHKESQKAPNHISRKSHQKRMEEIDDKFKMRQIYEKVQIDVKMEKGQYNHRQMKYRLYSKIKAAKVKEDAKHQSALKKRNILSKKGEINHLNGQLRKIFIQKRQKTKAGSQTNKNRQSSFQKITISSSRLKQE